MKKSIFTVLALAFLVFLCSSTAMALPYGIAVGDKVEITSYGPTVFSGIGGEFTMEGNNGYNWISYCIEKYENVSPNTPYWVGGINDRAIGGGGNSNTGEIGYDSLSDEAAYLYWEFQ